MFWGDTDALAVLDEEAVVSPFTLVFDDDAEEDARQREDDAPGIRSDWCGFCNGTLHNHERDCTAHLSHQSQSHPPVLFLLSLGRQREGL